MKTNLLLAFVSVTPLVTAQTVVVGPGDSLTAAVAGAASGGVVEIATNETYLGTQTWAGKTLTVRAAPGFRPMLVGSPNAPAVRLGNAVPATVGIFEGLRLAGGPSAAIEIPAFYDSGDGVGSPGTQVRFERCEFETRVLLDGRGDQNFDGVFTSCSFESTFELYGSGLLDGSVIIAQSELQHGLFGSAAAGAQWSLEVSRSVIDGGLSLHAPSGTSIDASIESSLFTGKDHGGQPAIETSGGMGGVFARFVNVTVSGYDLGAVAGDRNTTFENMLFHRNAVDLDPSVAAVQISHSLIPSGVHAGVGGNVQAVALLSGSYAPSSNGPVVDAGNDAAIGVGLFDLLGQPRFQDADSDGSVRINFGAIEEPTCATFNQATETIRPGFPPNPTALMPGVTTPPLLGATWDPVIDHTVFLPNATIDLLLVSLAPNNFYMPANGALLIDLGLVRETIVRSPGQRFALVIPESCGLPGFTFYAQGVSLGPSGGLRLTNAIDGIIGLW